MQRSRLKNIINKSLELSKPIRDSFDLFKEALPLEFDYYKDDNNYRLKDAWEAYGKPSTFEEALLNGLVLGNVLASIGYNEDTDDYEYLNKGYENDSVNRDIRVWEEELSPLVSQLKLGGYIRLFDHERNHWIYSKNSLEIEKFLKGNKIRPRYLDWYKTLPSDKSNTDSYDLERAYNELSLTDEGWAELENFRTNPEAHLTGDYKKPNHPTYGGYGGWVKSNDDWHYFVSPKLVIDYPDRNFEWYLKYWDEAEPGSTLHWIDGKTYKRGITEFKQGGQMNVIPEGALHARKNNMEGAGKDFTHKGIPVVTTDDKKELIAEIEKEEIIFNKDLTDFIEDKYKKFNDADLKDKDFIAISVGKRLVKEIFENTEDRTGLILEVENKL